MDTIFALSSGGLPAGVAVIRLSGPDVRGVLAEMTGTAIPPERRMVLRALRDPGTGLFLDRALVYWMAKPASFTGDDCAEFHCHGGVATVQAVIDSLAKQRALRMADAGEFTRRAFDNGRLDLTQVEGLADLIGAETEAQRRQALAIAEGSVAREIAGLRDRLIGVLAQVEARIDFSDEDDVDEGTFSLDAALREIDGQVRELLGSAEAAERVRSGLRVALIGPPNVGKSTLVNTLAARDVAIVHDTPGTTRDVLEARLDIFGYPVHVFDTAGMRAGGGAVEQEGMRRARRAAGASDLVLVLDDGSGSLEDDEWVVDGEELCGVCTWRVRTKTDLVDDHNRNRIGTAYDVYISAQSGEGLAALRTRLGAFARSRMATGDSGVIARQRQRDALDRCRDAVAKAKVPEQPLEITAEHIRAALHEVGVITGRVDVERVLDRLFGEFCIGK